MTTRDSLPAENRLKISDWVIILLPGAVLRIFALTRTFGGPVFEKYLTLGHDLITKKISTPFSSSPLYTFWIGLLNAVAGAPSDFIRAIQYVLGIASIILVVLIARDIFGRRAAIAAGLLYGCCEPVVLYESDLVTSSLEIILSLFMLRFLMHALANPSAASISATGIFLGLSIGVRPNLTILIPIIALLLIAVQKKVAIVTRNISIFLFSAAATVAPITIANYRASGEFILITSSGGSVFYSSNNYRASGLGYSPPLSLSELENSLMTSGSTAVPVEHELFKHLAERAAGKRLSYQEASSFYFHEGMNYLKRMGVDGAAFFARKAYFLLNDYEVPDTASLAENSLRISAGLSFLPGFGFIFILAVFGLLNPKTHRLPGSLLIFLMLPSIATALVFYVNGRLRVSLIPFLAIAAGAGLIDFMRSIRTRDVSAWAYITLMMALASLTFHRDEAIRHHSEIKMPAFIHSMKGLGALRFGNFQDAIQELTASISLDPLNARESYMNLHAAYSSRGDARQADEALRRASGAFTVAELTSMRAPWDSEAPAYHLAMGTALFREGKIEEAAESFEWARALSPFNPAPFYNLAILELRKATPDFERVIHLLETSLEYGMKFDLQSTRARRHLAECYDKVGRPDDAEKTQERIRFEEILPAILSQSPH